MKGDKLRAKLAINGNGGAHSPSASASGGQVNKMLVLLLFLMMALNIYQQTKSAGLHATSYDGEYFYGVDEGGDDNREETEENKVEADSVEDEDEADRIIRRSYSKSYAHILPCDEGVEGKACMAKTRDYFNAPADANSTVPSIPWWFQTLLRDSQSNGVYGFWHHFFTTQPAFNFCTIGKVATTEWRRVFCRLNADECKVPGSCGKKNCAWRTKKEMPADAPWAVFLRDPLERLLSGFLDKCYKPNVRRVEGHCEPNVVWNAAKELADRKGNEYPTLAEGLEGHDKLWFAAYVDALPLKWNVHFVPQALACDLHRKLPTYDFVGNMGQDFMFDLERMANRYGGQLPEVLNISFMYMDKVKSGKKNTGLDGRFHSTHAPAKVQQFYTAQTVRRGLELLSIDYVTLGLKVPEWARQMLRDDP